MFVPSTILTRRWASSTRSTRRQNAVKGSDTMKTMTCKQLGGPCDFVLRGDTADAVIKLQDKHLKEMVAGGDETHSSALKEMKGRWKHPLSGMAWYRNTKRDFAGLPEE